MLEIRTNASKTMIYFKRTSPGNYILFTPIDAINHIKKNIETNPEILVLIAKGAARAQTSVVRLSLYKKKQTNELNTNMVKI